MEYSRTNIISFSSFIDCYAISDKHLSSLVEPYNDMLVETALSDWLGLGHGYEQISEEDLINELEISTSEMNMNENQEEDKQIKDSEKKLMKIKNKMRQKKSQQRNKRIKLMKKIIKKK